MILVMSISCAAHFFFFSFFVVVVFSALSSDEAQEERKKSTNRQPNCVTFGKSHSLRFVLPNININFISCSVCPWTGKIILFYFFT